MAPLQWEFRFGKRDDENKTDDLYIGITNLITAVTDARVRVEFLESSESCLTRLEVLRAAFNRMISADSADL